MHISGNGLVSHAYRASTKLWLQFTRDNWRAHYEPSDRTDLCSLMRRILVAAPIAIAVNLAAVGWAVVSVVYLLFGLSLHLSGVGFATGVLLAVVALGLVIYLIVKGGAAVSTKIARSEPVHVVAEWYRAKKARICPIVEIGE